jgi:hypothetical protein
MTGGESYLLDAGWLFFAGWSLVVVTVSVIAFGRDFLSVPPLFEKRAFDKQQQSTVIGSAPSIAKTHARV